MTQVVLIDSGGYNIGSVKAALRRLDVDAELTTAHHRIVAASHVILPGVGAAGPAMNKLKSHGLDRLIPNLQQPVLGICLGMQLMYAHSAEGDTECLGIFDGEIKQLQPKSAERVPHMGWNQLQWQQPHTLQQSLMEPAWMYFVHSFAAPVNGDTVACVKHGETFTALAQRANFLAAQFHPERSAKAGQALFEFFLKNN